MPPNDTLTLPGVDTLPVERERQRALSQWWTPPDLARRVAKLAVEGLRFPSVIEPSAGSGVLARAVLDERPMARLVAVELDPTWATILRAVLGGDSVIEGDFLTAPVGSADVVVMNPPYEGGLDGAFLERAMKLAPRVVALLRLNALVGQERHDRVWSRIGRGWHLDVVAYCARRPVFLAAGEATDGAKSDFVAVRLVQARGRRKTRTEWWT
jgi:predicted RNA methylase